MKKMMLIAVGALALGTLAQTAIPQPVTSEKNKIPAVPSSTPATVQEYAPGALCRSYNIRWPWNRYVEDIHKGVNVVVEQLNSRVVAVDQGYDTTPLNFDGKKINVHNGNLVTWEGYFMAKKSGNYTIILSGLDCNSLAHVTFNDVTMAACRGAIVAKEINLTKGANKISIRVVNVNDRGPVLEYRLSSSVKPPKKITPAMLSHVVEDEEEW